MITTEMLQSVSSLS